MVWLAITKRVTKRESLGQLTAYKLKRWINGRAYGIAVIYNAKTSLAWADGAWRRSFGIICLV